MKPYRLSRLVPVFVAAALIAAGASWSARAQVDPFASVRAYPAGMIAAAGVGGGWPGAGLESRPGRIETGVWAGYNLTRRRDWGEHDDERGGGFGGGVEAAWFPGAVHGRNAGWFAGVRASFWRMRIDWRDDPATPLGAVRVGETDIIVVQPTFRAGYRFGFGRGLSLDVETAVGAEINVDVDGEDVGEGAILLIGLKVGL